MIAKQQAKREQTNPVRLHILGKYEKVENIMITKQQVKNKKKADLNFEFCKCV